jgi:hypothetical protein
VGLRSINTGRQTNLNKGRSKLRTMATIEDRVGVNKKKLQRDLEHVFSLFDEDSDGLLTLREWGSNEFYIVF